MGRDNRAAGRRRQRPAARADGEAVGRGAAVPTTVLKSAATEREQQLANPARDTPAERDWHGFGRRPFGESTLFDRLGRRAENHIGIGEQRRGHREGSRLRPWSLSAWR